MDHANLHPGLVMRLSDLAARIANLKRMHEQEKGVAKIRDAGEIAFLERRQRELEAQLQKLNDEGDGFRQKVKAEIEKFADDVAASIEDVILNLDADYRRD